VIKFDVNLLFFRRNIDKLKKIFGGFFKPYQHSYLFYAAGFCFPSPWFVAHETSFLFLVCRQGGCKLNYANAFFLLVLAKRVFVVDFCSGIFLPVAL
jgi:hypothetical protein